MTVELADIHVEDIKDGYVIHNQEPNPCKVIGDAWEYQNSMTGEEVVDLYVAPMVGSVTVEQSSWLWLTFDRGEIVQVEA